MNSYIFLICGMMLVTYIPRFLPLAFLSNRPWPVFMKRFLNYIPYTALGALIIPGVWKAVPEMPVAGVAGIVVAAAAAWIRGGLMLPVVASVLATFLVLFMR